MSPASTPRFDVANTSTQSWVSWAQRRRGCRMSWRARARKLLVPMLPPQFRCIVLKLDGLLHDRIIAVPLHKIGAAHERSVFRCAPVVMPQIEIDKVDGIGEGLAGQGAVGMETIDDVLRV